MQGHIVPQLLRTAAQGRIQGDVALGPVAISPLAFHLSQLKLRKRHTQRRSLGINPKQSLHQKPGTLLSGRLGQQLRPLFLPLKQVSQYPAAFFLQKFLHPFLRYTIGNGKLYHTIRSHAQIQIFDPFTTQDVADRAIRRFQRKIDRADHINYISSSTRNDVRKYFHIDLPERVIYNGATDLSGLRAERPARFSDLPEGFLFHISSLRPKKNVALLVDMMRHLPHERLVIAGDWQSGYGQMLQQKIAGLPTRNIVMLPNVSEAEKAWLYSACKAFLYPSLCEGFGLPPIEAMHFGKPVFLSTLTSLPEIGGKEAFYWDTLLPLPMAERVETALSAFSPAQKSEALKRNAARFDWDTCTEQYIRYYLEILGS